MSHINFNCQVEVNTNMEVGPREQSSSSLNTSSSKTEAPTSNIIERDNDSKYCEAVIAPSTSNSIQKAVETSRPQKVEERVSVHGEASHEQEEEITVEIMAPCYGSIRNINNSDDLEGCNNNNRYYASDEDTTDTAPLIPGNSHRQQSDSGSDKSRTTEHPKDHYHLVYMVFFLLGLSTLLPWNFFISLNQFWDYRFRDVNATSFILIVGNNSNSSKTELQKAFASYLSIASNVPNAIFVILNAIYGTRFSIRKRMLVSAATIILLFGVMTGLAKINSDLWQHTYLYVVLALVVLINIFTAIFQGGAFGVAGKFPPKYMGSAMAGQAFGGVFPALVNIIVVAMNIQEQDVGFACFLIATLVLALSLMAFIWTGYSHFFRYYAGEEGFHDPNEESAGDDDTDYVDPPPPNNAAFKRLLHVLRHSWEYCMALYLTFTITLCIFPALAVLIESQYKSSTTRSKWADDFFTPVTVFLLFNVGDLVGRTIANALKLPDRSKRGKLVVLALSLLRAAFIPLFIFCNAAPEQRLLPVIFSSDADFIVFMTIFALSNGYLGNICMLHGPKTETDSELQEETAMVLVACLVLGTGSGSFLSYPVIHII